MDRHEAPVRRWEEKAEEEEKDNAYCIYNPNSPWTGRILTQLVNRHEAPVWRWEEEDDEDVD